MEQTQSTESYTNEELLPLKSDGMENSDFNFEFQESEFANNEDDQVQKRKHNYSEGSTKRRGKYKMGAGKYRFHLMKAPTAAEIEKFPELAGKSCE